MSSIKTAEIIVKELEFDSNERSCVGVITKECVDRDKEVVLLKGLDFTKYKANPVVLFMHDPFYPVGKAAWWKQRTREGSQEIIAKTLFAESEQAEEVFQLVKCGCLKGLSIGMWWPSIERREIKTEDVEKRPAWAGARRIVQKAEVIEYSHVSIPSNPLALMDENYKGMIKLTRKYFEEQEPEVNITVLNPPKIRVCEPVTEQAVARKIAVVQGRL